jgi:hypothetical protein
MPPCEATGYSASLIPDDLAVSITFDCIDPFARDDVDIPWKVQKIHQFPGLISFMASNLS